MNLYFLVEGKRTEKKLYTSWFINYAGMTLVDSPEKANKNNFYIVSACGYPGILDNHLKNAVSDVETLGLFDYFVIVLDSEEQSEAERMEEVKTALKDVGIELRHSKPYIIVQHHCIETWLLGNRRIISRTPQSHLLRDYIRHYNVINNDPELMPTHRNFSVAAPFHESYLREIFKERNLTYTKRNPGEALSISYLNEIKNRHQDTAHLRSLEPLLQLLEMAQQSSRLLSKNI